MFHSANDSSRDSITTAPRTLPIHDVRGSITSLHFERLQIISKVMVAQALPFESQTSDPRQNEAPSLLA
ncbi:hypothetical protein SPHV1_50063 [Novosphingobium sp. KN65.2]|nr:hypothetical protein SPHV1_50063 [Novosphingobium sp. KN65.2]